MSAHHHLIGRAVCTAHSTTTLGTITAATCGASGLDIFTVVTPDGRRVRRYRDEIRVPRTAQR